MDDSINNGENKNETPIFDLNDKGNEPGSLTSIFRSEVAYTFVKKTPTGKVSRASLRIPYGWEVSSVCLLIINYLNSTKFNGFSQIWKSCIFNYIKDFFNFLESLEKGTDINSTALIFPWYLESIKDKFKEQGIIRRIWALHNILKWNHDENMKMNNVKHWDDIARRTLDSIPSFGSVRNNPSKTTAEKLQCDENDNELFLSVRAYCSWFILEMDRQRKLIHSKDKNLEKDILELVEKYGANKLSKHISVTDLKRLQKRRRRIEKKIVKAPEKPTQELIDKMYRVGNEHDISVKDIIVEGVNYETLSDACEAYVCSRVEIIEKIKKLPEGFTTEQYDECFLGDLEPVIFTQEDVDWRFKSEENNSVPSLVQGIIYPDLKTACKVYNVSFSVVKGRIRKLSDGYSKKDFDICFRKKSPIKPMNTRPVVVEGVEFNTFTKACEYYEISNVIVNGRISRLVNNYSEDQYNRCFTEKYVNPKQVLVEGVVFPTHKAACEYYGISIARVSGRINKLPDEYTNEQYDLCYVDRNPGYNFDGRDLLLMHERIKNAILQIIEENNNKTLLEFVCVSSEPFLNEVLDLIKNGEKPQFDKEKLLEKLKSDHFPVGYPLLEMIHPTVSEANSLSYLLATERMQSTGQDNLSLNDCELDYKGVQFVQYDKPRSSKKPKISAHYSSATYIYDVYKTWKEGSIKYHGIYQNGARKDKFNFLTVGQIRDKIKVFSLPSALYYTPLFFKSLSRKEAIKEESRCKLYIDAMSDAYKVTSNTIIDQGNGKTYIQKTVRPTLIVGTNALSQTRALLESKPIYGLGTEANDLLDASLSAHTPGVKKGVYKSRTTSNTVLKSGFEFSKSVSDKMLDDANCVAKLLDKTEVVTLKDLEIQLGIQSPFDKYSEGELINKLLDEAEKNGYTVGAIAELNNNGKTIVICTPLVAALILGEIKHIDSHIDDLKNINPFKVNQYKTRKIFLHEVIDSFPKKILKEGKVMLSKYNFPYPPLS